MAPESKNQNKSKESVILWLIFLLPVGTHVAPVKPVAPTPAPQQPQSQSNGNNSPNSGVTDTVNGYCNDGIYVTGNPSARGKANACYGHGGWRDY